MKERLATILGCCWNFRAFILFILLFERAHARLKPLYGLGISPPAFATTPPPPARERSLQQGHGLCSASLSAKWFLKFTRVNENERRCTLEVPWPPLRPWVPPWRFRKCAHSPGSDIGCLRAPACPLHAVSPGCVWPGRPPPHLSPLQSHLHPPPRIPGDPLGEGGHPCTPLPRRGERQPRAICISMKTRLRGNSAAGQARRLRDGFWALPLSAPRRSEPAPPPPAPAPPPRPLPFSAGL